MFISLQAVLSLRRSWSCHVIQPDHWCISWTYPHHHQSLLTLKDLKTCREYMITPGLTPTPARMSSVESCPAENTWSPQGWLQPAHMSCVESWPGHILIHLSTDAEFQYKSCWPYWFMNWERGWRALQHTDEISWINADDCSQLRWRLFQHQVWRTNLATTDAGPFQSSDELNATINLT